MRRKTHIQTLLILALMAMQFPAHANSTSKESQLNAEIIEKQVQESSDSSKKSNEVKSEKKSKSSKIGFFKLLIPGTLEK